MKNVSELYTRPSRPVKILQFGEGVFLRAFADYAVDIANEENNFNGNIAVILPRSGKTDRLPNRTTSTPSACAASRTARYIRKTAS